MTSKRMTHFIIAAMLLGVLVGHVLFLWGHDDGRAATYAHYVSILTDIFLRLIKMIISPLVFCTLVVGIARMGDSQTVGRVGAKTFAWFLMMSVISLLLGLLLVHLLQPGSGFHLPLPAPDADAGLSHESKGLVGFVHHIFPTSIVEAMASNEILQIVVFALFFGIATGSFGKKAEPLIDVIDMIGHVMLKVTTAVMLFAPVAVFAAVSAEIALDGLGIIRTYAMFMVSFYIGIAVLWAIIFGAGYLMIGKRVGHLFVMLKEPALLAFTTASSEAAYPKTLEQLERFGCSNRITSFVLPVGYSFNLDGSMMYCTFAAMFIAQIYGIELSLGQQFLMLAMLLVTSKGMAGVPRASLVVIAAILPDFGIPAQGVLLILGVDHFLDMARSATNVLGNGVATAVIAKSEKQLKAAHTES
jgi:Na+/H+-dicarboxylate symporter